MAGKMIAGLQVGLGLDSAEFKKGADEAKKKAQELGQTLESTGQQTRSYSSALNDAANAKKNFQYNLRNVGYQVQDFSTQVASGTSAAQALTQQLPQLLSGFGTLGVVLGGLAAVGIPLITVAFSSLTKDVKTLEDATKDASSAAAQFVAANNKAALSLKDIGESYYSDAAPALKALYQQLYDISKLKLTNEIKEFTKALTNEYAPIWKLALPEIFKPFMDSPIEKLSKDLGVSQQEAKKLFEELRAFDQGKRTFEELRDFVLSLALNTREATKEGAKFREQLLQTITTIQEAQAAKSETQKKEESEAEKNAKRQAERTKAYIDGLDAQIRKLREGEDAALRFEAAKYGSEALQKANELIAAKAAKEVEKPEFLTAIFGTQESRKNFYEEINAEIKELGPKLFFEGTALLPVDKPRFDFKRGEEMAALAKREIENALTPLEALEQRLRKVDELLLENFIDAEQYFKIVKSINDNFKGNLDPMKQLLEDLRDGFKSLGAEIVDAFMRGKSAADAFKNVARSLFQRFATRALNRFIDSFLPSGGSFLDLFKANGGPVNSNQPYIVGEKGPELFVPKSSGTIVPNNALAATGGSVVYNIQAIDVKSFEERIMGSNRAVWAANAYAQKSLSPRGRT